MPLVFFHYTVFGKRWTALCVCPMSLTPCACFPRAVDAGEPDEVKGAAGTRAGRTDGAREEDRAREGVDHRGTQGRCR